MITDPEISLELVQRLIAEQFPQWANLPIKPVRLSGWDNRTFHLGDEMSIRMPSAERYAAKVHIEQEWLPKLAPHLSYPIPQPLAMGQPTESYPWHWSVYKWIEGENADTLQKGSMEQFALDIARFLNELYKIDAKGGPLAGLHNFYRGASPSVYDHETRKAISQLEGIIDIKATLDVWELAISSKFKNNPVWVHGDFSVGNILVKNEKLAAVIDFGGMGVGDPACDLVIAYTFMNKECRQLFRFHMGLDQDTWDRARGWGLWKALITLAPLEDKSSVEALKQQQVINNILNDYR